MTFRAKWEILIICVSKSKLWRINSIPFDSKETKSKGFRHCSNPLQVEPERRNEKQTFPAAASSADLETSPLSQCVFPTITGSFGAKKQQRPEQNQGVPFIPSTIRKTSKCRRRGDLTLSSWRGGFQKHLLNSQPLFLLLFHASGIVNKKYEMHFSFYAERMQGKQYFTNKHHLNDLTGTWDTWHSNFHPKAQQITSWIII